MPAAGTNSPLEEQVGSRREVVEWGTHLEIQIGRAVHASTHLAESVQGGLPGRRVERKNECTALCARVMPRLPPPAPPKRGGTTFVLTRREGASFVLK